jgi:hypothetical protein
MDTVLEHRTREYTRPIGGTCFLCGEPIQAWRRSYAHVVSRDPQRDQRERKTHLACADAHADEWRPERVVGDMWRETTLTLEEHVAEVDRLRREWNEQTPAP